jgi:hypothetical protein
VQKDWRKEYDPDHAQTGYACQEFLQRIDGLVGRVCDYFVLLPSLIVNPGA